MMPRIYFAKHLAYLDTFSGMVPCKVLEVLQNGFGGQCSAGGVKIKLTATRGAYKRGEILTCTASSVIPREHRIRRNGQYRINTNYYWSKGEFAPIVETV